MVQQLSTKQWSRIRFPVLCIVLHLFNNYYIFLVYISKMVHNLNICNGGLNISLQCESDVILNDLFDVSHKINLYHLYINKNFYLFYFTAHVLRWRRAWLLFFKEIKTYFALSHDSFKRLILTYVKKATFLSQLLILNNNNNYRPTHNRQLQK